MTVFTLHWEMTSSADGAELANATLNPECHQPSDGEFKKRIVDNESSLYHE